MRLTTTKKARAFLVSALLVCLLQLVPEQTYAALSGTYTINPASAASATNYKTFASAVSDLVSGNRADGGTANGSGVSGAVIFNIANGTYNEQVSIATITGASATNTITFQSASGDSSKVILTYASGTSNDYTLNLSSAQYIIVKKITIIRSGNSTPAKVVVFSSSSNNQFLNNRLIGKLEASTSSSFSYADNSVVHLSSADSNNLFKNNYIINGHHGIFLSGTASSNKIIGNTLDSAGGAAIYAQNQSNLLIEGNLIRLTWNSSTAPYVAYGVRLEYTPSYKVIKNNITLDNGASTARGIVLFYVQSKSTNPGLIANNWIHTNTGTGSSTGISLNYDVEYVNVYYNTILNTYSNSAGSGFHIYGGSGGTGNNLLNNIIIHKGGGYVYDIGDMSLVNISNYNDLFTSGSTFGLLNGTKYSTFASWKTISKKEANSLNLDPSFVSYTDLRPTNPNLKGKGTPISGITTDIFDKKRKSSFPDIGAYEFPMVKSDASITALVSKATNCEGSSNISVTLKNYGTDPLLYVNISYTVNDTALTSTGWTGKLLTDSSTTVNLGNYNFAKASTAKLKVWPRSPNYNSDEFTFNDTLFSSVRINALPNATTGGDRSICKGESTMIGGNAVGGSVYSWTSKPAGFTSSLANPTVSPTVTTTYYLTEKSNVTLCENSDSLTVTVTTMPTAFVGTNRPICKGESTQIGGAAVTGNTYSWVSIPSGFTSTVSNPTVSPVLRTRYILTETVVATGCKKIDTVIIDINQPPVANTGFDKTICAGDQMQIGATAVSGNTYSWVSNPAGFTSNVSNPTVSPTVTTEYYLTETITATGCAKTDTVKITVNPLPSAFVGANRVVCAGQPVTLGTIDVPGRTYNWTSKPAGFSSTVSNPSVAPNVTTMYYLTETITATGCSKTDSVKVSVNPSPQANTGADQTICSGSSTKIGGASVSGNNYSWRSIPAGFISANANPTVSPTVTTIYILTERIGSAGCSKTDSVTITVVKADVAIQGQTNVCAGAVSYYTVSKVTGNTYKWTVTGGTIAAGQNTDSVAVKWGAKGSGSLKVVVGTTSSCKDSSTQAININEGVSTKWSIVKLADKSFRFVPEDTTLTSYNWNFGDGGTSTDKKPTHTFATNGNYKVSLTVQSSSGCVITSDSTFSTLVGIAETNAPAMNISIYPNPFKESTTISYALTEKVRVRIQVYDMTGKEIANIADATQTPGEYKYNFNPAQYNTGAGIYMVKIAAGDKFISKQIINVK